MAFGPQLKNLASICHRHIVRLLCCCTRQDNNLLVFEYMPNGSLGDLLHGPKANVLSWEIRYKIAMGAAKVCCSSLVVQYLHQRFKVLSTPFDQIVFRMSICVLRILTLALLSSTTGTRIFAP